MQLWIHLRVCVYCHHYYPLLLYSWNWRIAAILFNLSQFCAGCVACETYQGICEFPAFIIISVFYNYCFDWSTLRILLMPLAFYVVVLLYLNNVIYEKRKNGKIKEVIVWNIWWDFVISCLLIKTGIEAMNIFVKAFILLKHLRCYRHCYYHYVYYYYYTVVDLFRCDDQ